MKPIGITQRVIKKKGKLLDQLDNEWNGFLNHCNLNYELIKNKPEIINYNYLKKFNGIILSGGNSLISCGGDSSKRDETEKKIYRLAKEMKIPIIGVCRGMQLIQEMNGIPIKKIYGHVKKIQKVMYKKKIIFTNTYHNYGTRKNKTNLNVFAKTEDGVIKGIQEKRNKIFGIMWHPERSNPYKTFDIKLFKKTFRIK